MKTKNKPSRVSATQWGKTVTIEVEQSDIDLYELLEMFKGLAVGLQYSEDSWRRVIKELGAMYEEEDIDEALSEHNRDEEALEDEYPSPSETLRDATAKYFNETDTNGI